MNLAWAQDWLKEYEEGFTHMRTFYAERFEFEDVPTGARASTFDEVEQFLNAFLEGGGEQEFTATAYRGDARSGVVEWTWHGRHGADVEGIPLAGKQTEVDGCSVFVFDDEGRIAGERDFWDLATMLRQAGALAAAPAHG